MDIKDFYALSNDEQRKLLVDWRADRLTFKNIAELLGTTRNVIAGLCSRRGVSKLEPGEISARLKPSAVKKVVKVSTIPDVKIRLNKPVKPTSVGTDLWQALPDTTPIRLLPAGNKQCRWPIGHRTHTVCGLPTVEGSSWCPTHHAVVFIPAKPKGDRKHGRT